MIVKLAIDEILKYVCYFVQKKDWSPLKLFPLESFGDNLHGKSKSICWKKIRKHVISLSSTEFAQFMSDYINT